MQAGEDELEEKVEKERKGDDERGKEGEFNGEHEALGGIEGLHENHAAFGIGAGVRGSFGEGKKLGAEFVRDAWEGGEVVLAELLGFLRGVSFQGLSDLKVECGLDVEGKFGVVRGKALDEMSLLVLGQIGEVGGGFEGSFPSFEVGFGVEFGKGLILRGSPCEFDGTANDVHELFVEAEAGKKANGQGKNDARQSDAEVVEVVEEGLFGLGIAVVAELEELVEEKHNRVVREGRESKAS